MGVFRKKSTKLPPLSPAAKAGAPEDAGPALLQHSKSTIERNTKQQTAISSRWRGHLIRNAIKDQLVSVVAEPSIKASKAAQTASLPRDERGQLLPIFCSVKCFKVFGAGVYAYMRWQQYMALVFGIAFALSCPNMLFNAFGGALPRATWLTATTLGNVSSVNVSYGVVEFFLCLTFVVALFHGRLLLVRVADEVREEEERSSGSKESTVWLQGLPADTKAPELKERLQLHFGACQHVVLAHANRALLLRMSKRKPLLEDLYYRQALVYLARHGQKKNAAGIERLYARLEASRTKLQAHDKGTAALAAKKYDCSGDAFVTFASAAEARACVDHFGRRSQLMHITEQLTGLPEIEPARQLVSTGRRHLSSAISAVRTATGGHVAIAPAEYVGEGALPELPAGVSALPAPAPSDIIWEGLATSERERFWRQVLSTALTAAIACLGTAIIMAVTYFQGSGYVDQFIPRFEGFAGIAVTLLTALGAALPCIFGNVILFATTPLFADLIERHATFSDKESTVCTKLIFFQVFNTAMSALAFLMSPSTGWHLGRSWYALGGSVVMTILGPQGDGVVIQSLLDWITLDMPLRRHVFAPRQKTQLGMDRLYVKESDLYLAFRVQLASKFVVLCLAFGTALPMLYLFGCIFFLYGSLIDRHNLLRNQTPPARTSAKLTMRAHNEVFALAVVLHAALTPVFFHQLSLDDERSLALSPPPGAPPPPPLAPEFVHPSPPPPAAPAVGETHLVTAVYLTIALAVLTAVAVALFTWCTKPRRTYAAVRASEAVAKARKLLRMAPIDDPSTRDARAMADGPLPVPTIRAAPRQTYMPPQLSKTLLATFEKQHGRISKAESSKRVLTRQMSNLSPSGRAQFNVR